ncbi:hypothetical protein BDR04DRAFT_1149569 [Suillus decipiens]|nr:hypothetical protein BDR04DRAFT_1149569 [Suillus decipiens]
MSSLTKRPYTSIRSRVSSTIPKIPSSISSYTKHFCLCRAITLRGSNVASLHLHISPLPSASNYASGSLLLTSSWDGLTVAMTGKSGVRPPLQHQRPVLDLAETLDGDILFGASTYHTDDLKISEKYDCMELRQAAPGFDRSISSPPIHLFCAASIISAGISQEPCTALLLSLSNSDPFGWFYKRIIRINTRMCIEELAAVCPKTNTLTSRIVEVGINSIKLRFVG